MEPVAYPVYADLRGRSVFVSGGATGIGAELVRAYAAQRAKVGFVDIDAEAGGELATALRARGGKVQFHHCDITDTAAFQAAMDKVAGRQGPITVLLNNAANDMRHSLEGLAPDRFDELVAINLKHVFFAVQAVVPMMRKAGGGSIVNFGSISWRLKSPGLPVYSACKAALHGATRALAKEFGRDRIRVNTLIPGWVMTEKQKNLWVDETALAAIAAGQCLQGELLPRHVASMALFLGANASEMCSAQSYIVDGGWA